MVGCGARRCLWALTTFGDEHRATVALVTSAHVDRARASLAVTDAGPNAARYSPRWRAALARYERLLAEKGPGTPEPPKDLTEYVLQRVGLTLSVAPEARASTPTHGCRSCESWA